MGCSATVFALKNYAVFCGIYAIKNPGIMLDYARIWNMKKLMS
jgi:hypothetical protein